MARRPRGLQCIYSDRCYVTDAGPYGECVDLNPKTGRSSQRGAEGDVNTYIIIGAASGALVLIVTVLVIVCLVMRRRKQNLKKPAKTDLKTSAHDNPTYMSPEEAGVQQRPVTVVMAASSHHDDSGIYEHIHPRTPEGAAGIDDTYLDPVKGEKDRVDLGLDGPVVVADEAPEIDGAMGADLAVSSISDKVKLFEGVADDQQVVLQVDSHSSPTVAYTPSDKDFP